MENLIIDGIERQIIKQKNEDVLKNWYVLMGPQVLKPVGSKYHK